MKTKKGKFIVIYGANNLGKSAQVELLSERLSNQGLAVEVIKYPRYSLKPTGPRINAALREGLKLSPEELQVEFAQNRRDYQPKLVKKLETGAWVVSEDYKGTGIAWGVTYGVSLEKMEKINSGLLEEDYAILLDGRQFSQGIEKKHRHERGGLWDKARKVHQRLAKRYGWKRVSANQKMEKVASDIWQLISKNLL